MEKALISLGRRELNTLIEEDTGAELGCHFCHSQYAFTTDDLKELLARASRD
jgi:molecular chaperone Hsp33